MTIDKDFVFYILKHWGPMMLITAVLLGMQIGIVPSEGQKAREEVGQVRGAMDNHERTAKDQLDAIKQLIELQKNSADRYNESLRIICTTQAKTLEQAKECAKIK